MVTEAAVKMASVTLPGNFDEDFENDIEELLREQQQQHNHYWSLASFDRERDLNMYRSGSAPPTVEGSRNAIGSLLGRAEVFSVGGQNAGDVLSEEEMRSHLAYASYYHSNENLNPRLPPPLLSKEEWRAAQRFGSGGSAFGGIGDRRGRKPVEGGGSSSSLFSLQPGLSVGGEKESMEQCGGGKWLEKGRDGLTGLPEIGLEARRKSFADVFQEDFNHSYTSVGENLSHPVIRNAFDNSADPVTVSDVHLTQLHNAAEALDTIHSFRSGRTSPGLVRVQSLGSTMTQPFASTVDPSLSRSRTPDPQLIGRSSSPCLSSVGSRMFDSDSKLISNGFGSFPSQTANYVDVAAALAGLNMSSNEVSKNISVAKDDIFALTSNEHLQRCFSSSNLSRKIAALRTSNFTGSTGHYKTDSLHVDSIESNSNTYLPNHGFPPILNNQLDAGIPASASSSKYANRHGSQVGSGFQVPHMDLLHAQYQRASGPTSLFSRNLNEVSPGRNYLGTSEMDFTEYQIAYLEALLAQKKQQNGVSLSKGSGLSNGFYGTSGLGLGLPYPSSPISSAVLSSLGPGIPLRQNDRVSRLPSILQSSMGVPKRSWNHENGIMKEGFGSTLLEEFKNSKTRSFELSDIVDHVVEFSADQYGSRFIQQKLETATVEEKNKIFPEILPHARALMTDVFGNYVIQKFFEHGTESQRNQLAGQLIGHVLPLSLQMYGCRVIQKALEVVDVEKQIQMVSELDGSVMKCVRDQNGNHVIQKCIECVPQEKIQFIISSFYGQVVALSTHPYGCRVIQRVLEHCNDLKTQSIMMDEILQSVCTLALDQYGNYVVQHVLQHGKPEERSAMISKLSGQIVKMSQQKFASNVIEKCLTYGSPEERLLLIKEMLGSTEENEPLQAMMKDQFANYVVQKVLETCDDQNRELILSRIKVHLNALKRYTYGKHIVARVEKLIAAGERRMGMAKNS